MPSLRPLQTRKSPDCTDITILPNNQQQIEFGRQLELMVNQFKSYPSIATWVSKAQIYLSSCAKLTESRSFTMRAGVNSQITILNLS